MCCGKLCKEIEGGQCEGGSALEVSLTSGVTRMAWRCGPKHVKTAGHGRLHAVNVTRLLDSHLQCESSKRPWGPSRWCNLRSRDINALQFFYCDNFLIIGEIYSIFSPEGLEALIFSLLSVRVKSDKDPTGVQEQCRWIFFFLQRATPSVLDLALMPRPITADPNPTDGRTSDDAVFEPMLMGFYVLGTSVFKVI